MTVTDRLRAPARAWAGRSRPASTGCELRAVAPGSPAGRRAPPARSPSTRCWCSLASTCHPDELVAAGRLFGELTLAHPVMPPIDAEHPEVLEIDATRSRTDPRYRDEWENDTWHTDVSFMPDPPLGSLLSGVVIPPVGGDTAFADLQGGYDALSDPVRALVDGLEAEHDGERRVRRPPPRATRGRHVVRARFTVLEPVVHPVVRVHPVTGRRGLFVNPTFTTRAARRRPRAESDALLRLLYEVVDGARAHLPPPLEQRRRGRVGQPGDRARRRPRLRRRPPRPAPRHHRR